jgi:hypothetical protein
MPVKAVTGGQGRVRGGRPGAQQGSGGTPTNPASGPDTPIVAFGADLVAWYHASDATASSWPDRSANGYNLVQATGANQPAVSATSFMGKSGVTLNGTSSFMKATGVAMATNKFTVYAFAQYTFSATANQRLIAYEGNAVGDDFTAPGSAVLIQGRGDVGSLNAYRSTSLSQFQLFAAPDYTLPTVGSFYRIGSEWDSANHTLYADGTGGTPVADASGSLAAPGVLRIGSYMDGTAAFYQGAVREIIVIKNTVTSLQRQALMDHLVRDWTRILVCEGDSICYAPINPANGYTYQFLPNASPSVVLQNVAVGGTGLSIPATGTEVPPEPGNMNVRVARVDSKLPTNKYGKTYILHLMMGANEIANYMGLGIGSPAATQYAADVGAYCLDRKTAGWDKIALSTIMSRSDQQPSIDTTRNIYNPIIRGASWQAAHGVDVIVDFAADSIMGVDNAPTVNPTYFADTTHPSATGNTRLEAIFRAAINAL